METEKKVNTFDQAIPMWKIIFTQFIEHRMAVIGLVVTCLFIMIALLAPAIEYWTGIDPAEQNLFNKYAGLGTTSDASMDVREAKVHRYISDEPEESQKLQATIMAQSLALGANEINAISLLAQQDPPEILSKISAQEFPHFVKVVKSFRTFHLLGTDELGRDVLLRVVYGTRVSMGVGILVALASALIGLIIGAMAGYFGGILDAILMRVTDSLLSLPITPILIVIAAIDLKKLMGDTNFISRSQESIIKMIFILCLFSWMTVARLVRGSVLSLREREFILAAKTLGATHSNIILNHMIPNVIAPLLVSVTLGVGESILFESALSFLGLGIQPPTPSWGNMLYNAQELIYQAPHLAILPGLLILIVTVSFNYLGDGLQDAIDPKAIRR